MVRGLTRLKWALPLAGAMLLNMFANAQQVQALELYESQPIQATFNGQTLTYLSQHRPISLNDPEGDTAAVVFATEYIVDAPDPQNRPVIFIWNGGPSVASTTLHMAGFGPKRLVIPSEVSVPIEPPFVLEDNPDTLLDRFDLVFVDPPEAGLSRALNDSARIWLYSAEGDAWIMAEFIKQWLIQHQRPQAPYYLMGTSYGSIRAAIMTRFLADHSNPPLGVILFSQGVNLIENTQRTMNYVGFASNISQMAAIAWFHGQGNHTNKTLHEIVTQAEAFAMGPYLSALMQGTALDPSTMEEVSHALAGWLGLDQALIDQHYLLITKGLFKDALLAKDSLSLGTNDARYPHPKENPGPSNPPIQGVSEVWPDYFKALFAKALDADRFRYRAPETGDWDYGGTSALNGERAALGAPRSVFADFDWSGDLARGLDARPDFKIFIGIGIYDTLTTYGPARLLSTDPRFPPEAIALHYYEGGHSFYAHASVFKQLSRDIRSHFSLEIQP